MNYDIDKDKLGEFFGKNDPLNIKVFKKFKKKLKF